MLRITVHDYPGTVVLQLEGRVAVPWLRELEKCWLKTVASLGKPVLTVDVTGVTFIDAPGKACLTAMHREGAAFVARDCLTKSIVEEITRASPPDRES
jgi:anti-anti-sigma regulatory factor